MLASVFVGTSLDGFIARNDHAIDFLPETPEPHGFEEFYASVDAVVIGRLTYEKVLTFGEWAYGQKPVFVLSSRPLDFSGIKGNVQQLSGEPAEVVASLEAKGVKHAYIDGGITVQRFLRAGLIQRLTVTRVPVIIGEGLPLFGPLDRDIQLRHIRTQSYPTGLVQSEYEVIKG